MSAALDIRRPAHEGQAAGIGLWVFIGVASTLFALFLTAYAMRMDEAPDWTTLAMPWQLWLSSGWLIAGSVLLQRAAKQPPPAAQHLLLAGGACAIAFVLTQLWAWQSLADARVSLTGNPAASFFYVLTALHGLHVLGGLVGWSVAVHQSTSWRIALVARYWHFLLAVWGVLFAALGWLTPGVVAFICGRG
ncbi:MAG: bb3-type cytochrome oxidase subunit III [Methylibium sp.]|uniref:bb3-type cytochrome oxidase subunit III n=1 Tax=Methylibium sp. TaxID=2067992 RepID=UPI001829DCC7|nr:bb3-type cytochrome oxidase subunit III [Methylibium sp.]MBA3598468.1 bb3-type cytochrome oxidase subunit III [Methylibium sp.]